MNRSSNTILKLTGAAKTVTILNAEQKRSSVVSTLLPQSFQLSHRAQGNLCRGSAWRSSYIFDQRIVQAEPHLQKILIKKNTIKFRQRFSEFLFVHYGDSDDLISRL